MTNYLFDKEENGLIEHILTTYSPDCSIFLLFSSILQTEKKFSHLSYCKSPMF